jgi:hypothetical protein
MTQYPAFRNYNPQKTAIFLLKPSVQGAPFLFFFEFHYFISRTRYIEDHNKGKTSREAVTEHPTDFRDLNAVIQDAKVRSMPHICLQAQRCAGAN